MPEDPSEPADGPHGRAVEWDLVAGERDVPAALARFRDADMMRRVGRALRRRGTRI